MAMFLPLALCAVILCGLAKMNFKAGIIAYNARDRHAANPFAQPASIMAKEQDKEKLSYAVKSLGALRHYGRAQTKGDVLSKDPTARDGTVLATLPVDSKKPNKSLRQFQGMAPLGVS